MKLTQRLLVLLITVTMMLPGSFVQAFASEEAVDGSSVVVSEETAGSEENNEEIKEEVKSEETPAAEVEEAAPEKEEAKAEVEEVKKESSETSTEADETASVEGPDTSADIETADIWEKTLPDVIPSDIRKAVVQVAKSQLKYKESAENYTEDSKGNRHAYTRYGEFTNEPYADEWDAEFVLFVLNYAKVMDVAEAFKKDNRAADQGDGIVVPVETDTEDWVKALDKSEFFIEKDGEKNYEPEAGDIVFFDYEKENNEHAKGLIAGVIADVSEGRLEVFLASSGSDRNEVVMISCGTEEAAGFVSLKDIAPSAFKEGSEAADKEESISEDVREESDKSEDEITEEAPETVETSDDSDKGLVHKSIRAEINNSGKKALMGLFTAGDSGVGKEKEKAIITLAGEMPEDAYAEATPVDVEIEGQKVLTAYDITIYTTDDRGEAVEWQPSSPLSVSIFDSKLESADTSDGVDVFHMETEDAQPQLVTETRANDNKVVFEAESFSIYAISAPTYYITYEFYLDKEFTQEYEFELEGEESEKELKSNRIIVKNGDTLRLPAQPKDIENFRGWFTENDDEVKPGEVSGITQTDTVKVYARNGNTAYVVFHERQITETSGEESHTYFPVTATSKVLLNNGSGAIDISEIEPQITYDDIEFVGWSTINSYNDNDRTIIDDAQVAASDTITAYEDGILTITGTVNLYPVYKSVRYVRFYTGAVGSGASYISSSSVGAGEPLSTARPLNSSDEIITPTWTGYEFLGWLKDESKIREGGQINYNKLIVWDDAQGQLTPSDYFENTAAGWDAQTEAVNNDITLYAVWKPVSSAQYTVAIWHQSINDAVGLEPDAKAYVLYDTDSKNGKPGTLIDYTTEANASAAGVDTPTGFEFSRGESATIEPDGSTTINVYYDRQTYTVIVKPGAEYSGPVHGEGDETVYAQTSDTSGKLFGSTSGKPADQLTPADVFELEYRFKGWRDGNSYYNGTVYNAWLVLLADRYSNPPGVNAGTVGFVRPFLGVNTDIVIAEYSWYKKGTNEEYSGNRYKEMEPYVAYYTGLYEQPIGFDYNLKYYYQPEESKHIRVSNPVNGNQYYIIRGSGSPSTMYYDGIADSSPVYVWNEGTQSYSNSTGATTVWVFWTQYKALYYTINRDSMFSFPTGNSNIIDMPDLTDVAIASFKFDDTAAAQRYGVANLEANGTTMTFYKCSIGRVLSDITGEEKNVTLHKFNGYSEANNLNGNTLTVFADSEQSTYPATTSYYKVDAPDPSLAGFTPYANYTTFLNEYKNKVASDEVNQFGGSAQTTSTNINVAGLCGEDAVLDGFTYKSYYNNSWKPAAASVSTAGSSNDIKLLFEPNEVTVNFKYMDGSIVRDAGSIAIPRGFSFNCFTETGDNPNATYVESYKDGAGITPPSGKVFDSWCYDVAGTQAFDPSRPVTSDITLYAKFDYAWYTANIDPKGGVIRGGTDGSTWFWRQNGTYIDRYENIMREYIESDEGSFYYYYNDRDASETYSGQGNVARTSGYISESDLAGWTQIDSTTYKDGSGNIYANVDTSVKYEDDYHLWKLVDWYDESTGAAYDFSSPVTKDTYIYALWKNLDTYKIRFDAGDGYHIGSNSIDVLPSTGDDKTRILNENFIDNAEILIQYYAEPNDPSDTTHQFRGWRMKLSDTEYDDKVYQLGEVFNLDYHYADEDGIVTLEAVYDKLGTTSITYNSNGGTGNLTDLEESGIQSIGTNRLYNIEINDKFNLSSGAGFTKTGYALIGWSTDPDRKAEDFDPEGNLNVDFDLEEEVLVDDLSANTLYAVWHCLDLEVYTYKNGDWQHGTKIAEGEYAPAAMASKTPHQVQEAAKAGLTPNTYDLSEYTFGYAKIEVDGTDVDVTNIRFEEGKWQYSTDNGTTWNQLPAKPLRVYYFKTEIDAPVKYIKVEDDGSYSDLARGTAAGLVKNSSPNEETVVASDPRVVKTLVGEGDGLVNEYNAKYSGYAYAIGSSDKADGLYAISQNLRLRNDKDGFRYSTDGTNWTLWNIDVPPHIYVVYYPKGFVYITVKALMTGDLVDTTLDIPYSYSISTTTWSRTIRRNNNQSSWTVGNLTSSSEPTESDSFTLKSGQSKVFVLSNITDGNSSATINTNNTSKTITAKTQSITISQEWIDNYTLEITDVKDADGTPGEGTKNASVDPGTYTISSVKDDPAINNPTGGSRTYTITIPENIVREDTTATFNNIRKTAKVDIEKTLDDKLADEDKTFTFTATASETASDGTTISCDLDPVEISLGDGDTKMATIAKAPVGARLLITETNAEMYDVIPSAAKTANAKSDITDLLVRDNTVRFKVPEANNVNLSVAKASFINKRKTVDVKILKVDEQGRLLDGATFVTATGASPLPEGSTLATDGSSTILDGKMYYEGKYPLIETVVPEGYKPVSGTISIRVSKTGAVTASSSKPGEVEVSGSVDDGYVIKIVDEQNPVPAPTGHSRSYLPFILILIAAIVMMIVIRNTQKRFSNEMGNSEDA